MPSHPLPAALFDKNKVAELSVKYGGPTTLGTLMLGHSEVDIAYFVHCCCRPLTALCVPQPLFDKNKVVELSVKYGGPTTQGNKLVLGHSDDDEGSDDGWGLTGADEEEGPTGKKKGPAKDKDKKGGKGAGKGRKGGEWQGAQGR